MTDSILNSTKQTLGLAEDYDVFDVDVTMHINSALATLNQLGVGPAEGFMIEDTSEEWADFIDDVRLNPVKSYVFLRVKMLFDMTGAGRFLFQAYEQTIKELEWRLMVQADPPLPVPVPVISQETILDGGGP